MQSRLFLLISLISILSITGLTAYVVAVTMTPTSVGSIVDDGTTLLTNPRTVEVVDIAGQLIAIVTSRGDNGIEIIDVSDPDEPTSLSNCADGDGTQSCGATNLADPWGVATYTKDGSTYAVVTSNDDKSIEIIDVTTPASPESVGRVQDTTYLNLATFLKITTIGDSTYAVVASSGTKTTSSHVTMVDITDPANPQVGGSLTDTTSILLKQPKSIDVYTVDASTYAVVASYADDGIVIVDISDPNALTHVANFGDTDSSCSDDGGHSHGNCELNGATGIEIFSIGSSTYAVVASQSDAGIQIIDITTPSSPDAVGQVEDDATLLVNDPRAVDVFSIGTSTYVLVSDCGGDTCQGGGIEVLDISDPTAPTTVGEDGARLANSSEREMKGTSYSTVYTLSNSTGKYLYAIALGFADDGLEIIHLGSEPTVTITSSSGSSGDTINSTVFSLSLIHI